MTDPPSPITSSQRRGSVAEARRRGSDAVRDDDLRSPTLSVRDPEGDLPMTEDMIDRSIESKAELIAAHLSGAAKDEYVFDFLIRFYVVISLIMA